MTIDESVRTQIVLGAVNAAITKLAALTAQAAGDAEALDRLPDLEALIARSAAEITAAIDPRSALSPADRRRAQSRLRHQIAERVEIRRVSLRNFIGSGLLVNWQGPLRCITDCDGQ